MILYFLICHRTGKRIVANKMNRFVLVPFQVPCSLLALLVTKLSLQELRAGVHLLLGLGLREVVG